MTLQHRCSFCDWQRGEGAATLLEPLCERCGCVMDAVPARATVLAAPGEGRAVVVARRIGGLALLLGIVPLVLVAAKLGYGHGGLPVATAATAVAALLLYVFLAPAPR
jgi:hypothetical protein